MRNDSVSMVLQNNALAINPADMMSKYTEFWPFPLKHGPNQMQVEEEGGVQSDVKCLTRRWAFSACCEWRCSPGRGGKVSPSFGSLEEEKSRPSEATTSSLRARRTGAMCAWIIRTHNAPASPRSLWYLDKSASPAAEKKPACDFSLHLVLERQRV